MRAELAVWSKDIIFLVSDGYTSGAHAWINAYHEEPQSSASVSLLLLLKMSLNQEYRSHQRSGRITNGLNLGCLTSRLPLSFFLSHWHLFRFVLDQSAFIVLIDSGRTEALNGLLPNIDLINSVAHISRWTGGAPVRLHNIPDELRPDTHSSFPLADHRKVKEYELAGKNVWEMVKRQSLGIPSGPEGVYARFVEIVSCSYGS